MTTTNITGAVHTTQGNWFQVATVTALTDGTAREVKLYIGSTEYSLGEALDGQTIDYMTLAPSTGSIMSLVEIYDAAGARVFECPAGETTTLQFWEWENLAITVKKGAILKILTAD